MDLCTWGCSGARSRLPSTHCQAMGINNWVIIKWLPPPKKTGENPLAQNASFFFELKVIEIHQSFTYRICFTIFIAGGDGFLFWSFMNFPTVILRDGQQKISRQRCWGHRLWSSCHGVFAMLGFISWTYDSHYVKLSPCILLWMY